MAADAIAVRIAHLEGAFEQVDKRLEAVERKVDAGFAELRAEIRAVESGLRSEIAGLRSRADRQFYWLLGVLILIGSGVLSLGLRIGAH